MIFSDKTTTAMSNKTSFPKIAPRFLAQLESLVLSDIAFTKSRAWPGHVKRLSGAGVQYLIVPKEKTSLSLLPKESNLPSDFYIFINIEQSLKGLDRQPSKVRPITTFAQPRKNSVN